MPMIYDYYCVPKCRFGRDEKGLKKICSESCSFRIKSYGPYMYLLLKGKEKILPHPLEESVAKRLTGKKLDELAKKGLVRFKHDKICLNCLRLEKDCGCKNKSLLEIPKLEGMTCPECGKGKIVKSSAGIS